MAQQALPPLGQWRDHLPYQSSIDLASGDGIIYSATPFSLFSVSINDRSIERLSRVTGLSETGISAICYDQANGKLIVAYSNSNIDIIYRNDIINVPDLKQDNVAGNKAVYSIFPLGKLYFLSTGLGVVVVDGERYEITESWLIGTNGNQVSVSAVTHDGSFFYAATGEGLKKADASLINLADHHNWQLIGGNDGLPTGNCQNVLTVQNKVIAQVDDTLFAQNGTTWTRFYEDGWRIVSVTSSENKISICQQGTGGQSRIVILNSDGSVSNIIQQAPVSLPREAIIIGSTTWIADERSGLLQFTGGVVEQYQPNSPAGVATGEIAVYNEVFYATAGGVDESWNALQNTNGIYEYKDGNWASVNQSNLSALDSMRDFISIAIDPRDETIWAGSYGGGLLRLNRDRSYEIIKQQELAAAFTDPSSFRVAGIAFDTENNLWLTNPATAEPLLARKPDGTFMKFATPFAITENALAQVLVDDNNYKWVVPARGGGLIVFDHGTAVENTGDDRWKLLRAGAGNGNLPNDQVTCLARDKNGFIWVGTTNGIAVIQCPQEIFSGQGCEAVWPIVKQGNFAGYLFAGEEVRSIAVDGADRKWVATKKGVWLISATGEKLIYQFTELNSPLLSNDVKKIGIDGKTGEVFFATAKGICSFRSTATEGGEVNESVLVFPNPVPPGYSGSIGIRGLSANSIVKITELNGRLVFQTRAAGGQAVWDGRDYRGRRISTGVYLVLISNDERTEKAAARIIFINK